MPKPKLDINPDSQQRSVYWVSGDDLPTTYCRPLLSSGHFPEREGGLLQLGHDILELSGAVRGAGIADQVAEAYITVCMRNVISNSISISEVEEVRLTGPDRRLMSPSLNQRLRRVAWSHAITGAGLDKYEGELEAFIFLTFPASGDARTYSDPPLTIALNANAKQVVPGVTFQDFKVLANNPAKRGYIAMMIANILVSTGSTSISTNYVPDTWV